MVRRFRAIAKPARGLLSGDKALLPSAGSCPGMHTTVGLGQCLHLPSVPGCGTRQARSVLTGPPAMVGRAGALGGLGRPPQRLGVAVSLGRTGGQQHRPRCRGQPFHSLFLQTQGSGPVTLELVIPFIKPEDCILVRNIGIHSPGDGTGCCVAALPLPHMRSWSSPWPSL